MVDSRVRGYLVRVPLWTKSFLGVHICSYPNCSNSSYNNSNRTYNRFALPKKTYTHKKKKISKLTCERSIKPFKKTFVLAGNRLLQTNEIISSKFRRLTQLFCLDSTIFRIFTALKQLIYILKSFMKTVGKCYQVLLVGKL